MVPHFKRLSDFILAKRWYMRAVCNQGVRAELFPPYMPGPERDDLAGRMYRHGFCDGYRLPIDFAPGFSPFQIPYKDSHKFDIRLTSGTHKP